MAGHQTQMQRDAKSIMGGRKILYTSFETPKPRPLMGIGSGTGRTSGVVPEPTEYKDMIIKKDATTNFFGRKHFLSNFYYAPFAVNGHTYPTVEHYYEACKVFALVGSDYARSLKNIQDPGQVKQYSKKFTSHLGKRHIDQWRHSDGVLVIKVAMTEKFRQNREIAEQLLRTGDNILVQCNKFDSLWAVGMEEEDFSTWLTENDGAILKVPTKVGPDTMAHFPNMGKGKNLLGHVIMSVRDQLRTEITLAAQLGSVQIAASNVTPTDGTGTVAESTTAEVKPIARAESPGGSSDDSKRSSDDSGSSTEAIGSERDKKKKQTAGK